MPFSVIWMLKNQFTEESTEIPASWFGILNSFYIIAFAPLVSKIWESKFNPSATVKFGLGLILLGLGFGILAFGSASIPPGAKTASVELRPNKNEYIIQKGDTLWDIAQKHDGLSVWKIKSLNNLDSDNLKPGTKIILPSS